MSKFDEMREDYRLSRLENNYYRVLFIFLDFFKGLLKLGFLGGMVFGIWYLTHGYETLSPASGGVTSTSPPAGDQSEELTAERIAALKEFAEKNRNVNRSSVVVPAAELPVVGLNEAELPEVRTGVDVVSLEENVSVDSDSPQVAGESVVTAVTDLPVVGIADSAALDNKALSVFDELQRKLEGEGAGNTQPDTGTVPAVSAVVAEADTDEEVAGPDTTGEPAVIEVPEVEVSVASESTQSITDAKFQGLEDAGWILAQNADDYLIQVGSTTNRPFLLRFEKQLPETQPRAVFEMLIRSESEYVLTYGLFETKAAATAELSRLSQTARKYGAYVRQLRDVQRQVRDLGKDLAAVPGVVDVADNAQNLAD